jgi:hypothetical protein
MIGQLRQWRAAGPPVWREQPYTCNPSVTRGLHPGNDVPESSSRIVDVPIRGESSVSMIDRLSCCIAKVRTDVGARHFGVIAFYAAM